MHNGIAVVMHVISNGLFYKCQAIGIFNDERMISKSVVHCEFEYTLSFTILMHYSTFVFYLFKLECPQTRRFKPVFVCLLKHCLLGYDQMLILLALIYECRQLTDCMQ